MKPERGKVYTARELYALELPDIPHLGVRFGDRTHPVQTSHVSEEELLKDEVFANTKWQYQYTTSEWVPLFLYVGDTPKEDFLKWEEYTNSPLFRGCGWLWVVPKHCPREQYSGD